MQRGENIERELIGLEEKYWSAIREKDSSTAVALSFGPSVIETAPIAALPHAERPRERLWSLGPAALTTVELVAILLGSGGR